MKTITRHGVELGDEELLARGEVAEVCKVHPKTVTRWADDGWLPVATVTRGGRRRYRVGDVRAFQAGRAAAAAEGGEGR